MYVFDSEAKPEHSLFHKEEGDRAVTGLQSNAREAFAAQLLLCFVAKKLIMI